MSVFLDASAVIYWVESPDPFHAALISLLRQVHEEHASAGVAVSRLSVLECFVKPLRQREQRLIREYKDFFSRKDVMIVELSPAITWRAALIRAELNLSTPDALQAACALSLGSDVVFVTGDDVFGKVPGLTVRCV